MASHYSRGAAFERRVRDLLESIGYLTIRSAGSKGVADLVALSSGSTLLVQCKRSGLISTAEWNTLFSESQRIGARAVLAKMRGKRGTALYHIDGLRVVRGAYPMTLWTIS